MSVRLLTDTSQVASPLDNIRCNNLQVDGRIVAANSNSGTFDFGIISLTGSYANDSYSAAMSNLSYSKFTYSVNLQLRQFEHSVVSSGGLFTFSTLQSDLRPASTQRYLIPGINNGTIGVCTLEIAPSGIITLYNGSNPTTFTAGVCGIPNNISVTYTIN